MQASPSFEQQATHHVCLVLDNYEDLYDMRREIVTDAMADYEGDRLVMEVAVRLKAWCEDIAIPDPEGEGMSMLALELLGLSLAWVDWRAMAADYIAEEA